MGGYCEAGQCDQESQVSIIQRIHIANELAEGCLSMACNQPSHLLITLGQAGDLPRDHQFNPRPYLTKH